MQDTLTYVKKLEAVGIPRKQAEAQVEIMSQIVDSNFATKQDLKDLAIANKQDLKDLAIANKQDLKDLGSELRLEIKDATMTYGKMLTVAVGIIIAAMGIMLKL